MKVREGAVLRAARFGAVTRELGRARVTEHGLELGQARRAITDLAAAPAEVVMNDHGTRATLARL